MSELLSIRRIIKAAGHSLAGLASAWSDETAFKQEVIALVLALPLGYWLANGNPWLYLALVGSVVLMMTVELLNSAIEAAIDRIGIEHHTLSGKAKDCGSAAVLLAGILTLAIWCIALYQRFT